MVGHGQDLGLGIGHGHAQAGDLEHLPVIVVVSDGHHIAHGQAEVPCEVAQGFTFRTGDVKDFEEVAIQSGAIRDQRAAMRQG